jgi:hypothetical protein
MSIECNKPVERSKRMPDPAAGAVARRPGDSELRVGLERALSSPILSLSRRASRYRTSFPLEELDVILEDGGELRLVFKDLGWEALEPAARVAKPEFLHDPLREPAVYASLLEPRGIGPRYHGATIEPAAGRYWLFVERVEGRELYQAGDLDTWRAVGRWLGEAHVAFAGECEEGVRRARLVDYDGAYYRRWLERARSFVPRPGRGADALDWLAARYDGVVASLLELPKTVIHGELYASNVIVVESPGGPRVVPVDWEMAGWAPGIVDLAALVSGGWDSDEREAIVAAYAAGGGTAVPGRELALARLHLAVQWLGWAPPEWAPPEGQRHDWLADALTLAEELEL